MNFFKKTINNFKKTTKFKSELTIIGTVLKTIFQCSGNYELAEQTIKNHFIQITNQADNKKFMEYSMKYNLNKIFSSETLRTDSCTFDDKKINVLIEYIKYVETNEIIFIMNKFQEKSSEWYNSKIEMFVYNKNKLEQALGARVKDETF